MGSRTITAVPGVAVGHHTDPAAATGVTVLTFPEPNVAVVDVRGGAPGTREIGTVEGVLQNTNTCCVDHDTVNINRT